MKLPALAAAVLIVASPLSAQTTAPADDIVMTEADRAFEPIQQEFQLLYESLRNSRGIADSDEPAIRACLEDAREFTVEHPDHVGGLALEVQLLKWLRDEEGLGLLYERLMQARPDDVRFALSWAKFKQDSVEGDPVAILEIYRTVHERFPTNASVCETYARQLMDQARYAEAIDVLRGAELDPAEAPKAVYMLADATFAEQRFEEVGSILDTIPESALARDARLRGDVERLRPLVVEHIDFWAAEQELRAAETEAGDLPMAEIHTSKGRVVIELFENEAPNTVANFISLAESGFYDGTKFHRFVPDFMVQGGDPNSKDDAPEDAGTPGSGNPGYFIPDEHDREDHRNHFRDSVAMAKQAAPNTAGCQFYLNHRPTPWLNGRHTVFGRVVDGMDVRVQLREDDEITAVVILRKRDHEYTPETVELPAPLVPPTTPGG